MARPCLFNCKSEGPPGPIWCTQCGHDPKCCTCEDWPNVSDDIEPTNLLPEDYTVPDPDFMT